VRARQPLDRDLEADDSAQQPVPVRRGQRIHAPRLFARPLVGVGEISQQPLQVGGGQQRRAAVSVHHDVVPAGAGTFGLHATSDWGLLSRMAKRVIVAGVVAALLAHAAAVVAAPADPGERAEALLVGGAINRYVAKQLPSTFSVRGDRDAGISAQDVTVVDARYCGGGKDAGRGRFVGVVRPDGAAGTLPALEAGDCRAKLDEVAKRLAAAPDAGAIAAVELLAEWVPSELRVSIGDVAGGGEGGRALARTMARAKAAGPLATVETSGLQLATERGASLSLDLALSFLKGNDGILSTLTVACPGCAPTPRGVPIASAAGAAADVDAVVAATLRFADRLVALYSEDGPLRLQVDRQEIEIRNLQLVGGEGMLSVRGRATSRAYAESAQVQIDSSGADLRLTDVRADAQAEDCRALSGGAAMRCSVRNAARGPAAAALAAAMVSRYRGKPLRTLIAPPPFSFEAGGRRMTLRLTPTRASATAGSLVVHGKADVE
jgi:hypothetical protein